MDWYLKVLKQYADFSGRARRKEYWMFMLFHYLFVFLLVFLIGFSSDDFFENEDIENLNSVSLSILVILGLYFFGTIIPFLAVTVRRLHDIGKSGWWYLIKFIPYIGSFIIFIFACMDGNNGPNEWGENPKGIGNDSAINQIGKE